MLFARWKRIVLLLLAAPLALGCAPASKLSDKSDSRAMPSGNTQEISPADQKPLEGSLISKKKTTTNAEHYGERVTIKGTVNQLDRLEGTGTLTLDFEVENGWHIYAMDAPSGVNQATKIDLRFPPNVVVTTAWNSPQPQIHFSSFGMESTYSGHFQLTRSLTFNSFLQSSEITCEVSYQACCRQQCLPLSKATLVIPIPND
ncbi:protein-disulfide reductase DsbD domain-containing protein [Novipirellula sp. SH528]|uniref:protein-disulfide reductase DsbD domain-containing protein n=1 Tax=Novipirellula sp. SH528 TaxID=3454466 RepID=UPI003FA0A6A2